MTTTSSNLAVNQNVSSCEAYKLGYSGRSLAHEFRTDEKHTTEQLKTISGSCVTCCVLQWRYAGGEARRGCGLLDVHSRSAAERRRSTSGAGRYLEQVSRRDGHRGHVPNRRQLQVSV